MMKRNILAVIVPALLVAGTANAAEIYNKDGNKVDLYGKAVGLHYFSWDLRAPAPTPSHLRATVAIKGSFRG
ncbi:hypothetical protein RNO67_14110, partial [Escherichia coli]|nr:hypothetical protein [Escherichia coli]